MIFYNRRRRSFFSRLISFFVAFSFSISLIIPPAYAQLVSAPGSVTNGSVLTLPAPGTMVSVSPVFVPALLKGIKVHPDNPLKFDFLVNTGDSDLQGEALKAESQRLIKYFLASLTIPEKDLWVNLSPYEEGRIIEEKFGTTEMGKDLLSQDYLLKQLTASLLYPEDDLGRKFWKRVKKLTYERYGTTDVPMETFNKVWIVPEKAVVYEKGDTAFVVDAHLKVMLEEDYLAREASLVKSEAVEAKRDSQSRDTRYTSRDTSKEVSALFSEIIREVILPEIEKEVNEGKNFAQLRQIYNSLILAAWFKQALKESLLGQIYVDRKKIAGVDIDDKDAKEKIYQQYLEAYQKGVYSYIKEDEDYFASAKTVTPRKYFSGGAALLVSKASGSAAAAPLRVLDGDAGADVPVRILQEQGGSNFFLETIVVAEEKKAPVAAEPAASAQTAQETPAIGDGDLAMVADEISGKLNDRKSEVRWEAVQILGRRGDQKAGAFLFGRLKREKVKVQIAIIEALGHLRYEEAVGKLIELLRDPQELIHRNAAIALAQIAFVDRQKERIALALKDVLTDQRIIGRSTFAKALREIGYFEKGVLEALIVALENDPEIGVRMSAARALDVGPATESVISALDRVVNSIDSEAMGEEGKLRRLATESFDKLRRVVQSISSEASVSVINVSGQLSPEEIILIGDTMRTYEDNDYARQYGFTNRMGQVVDITDEWINILDPENKIREFASKLFKRIKILSLDGSFERAIALGKKRSVTVSEGAIVNVSRNLEEEIRIYVPNRKLYLLDQISKTEARVQLASSITKRLQDAYEDSDMSEEDLRREAPLDIFVEEYQRVLAEIEKAQAKKAPGLLQGKIGLVSGAAGEMGSDLTQKLLNEGATVIFTGRTLEKLNAKIAEYVARGYERERMIAVEIDNTNPEQIRKGMAEIKGFIEKIKGPGGTLDAVAIAAGTAGTVGPLILNPVGEGQDENFQNGISNLFIGDILLGRELAEIMTVGSEMDIVTTMFSRTEYESRINYVMSKNPLRPFFKAMGRDLGKRGIRLNLIYPGGLAGPRIETMWGIMDANRGAAPGTTAIRFFNMMRIKGTYIKHGEVSSAITWSMGDESSGFVNERLEASYGMDVEVESATSLFEHIDTSRVNHEGDVIMLWGGADIELLAETISRFYQTSAKKIVVNVPQDNIRKRLRAKLRRRDIYGTDIVDVKVYSSQKASEINMAFTEFAESHGMPDVLVVLPQFDLPAQQWPDVKTPQDWIAFGEQHVAAQGLIAREAMILNALPENVNAAIKMVFVAPPLRNELAESSIAATEALVCNIRAEERDFVASERKTEAIYPYQLISNGQEINDAIILDHLIALTAKDPVVQFDEVDLYGPTVLTSYRQRILNRYQDFPAVDPEIAATYERLAQDMKTRQKRQSAFESGQRLRGKWAVLTGAAGETGKIISRRYLDEGASVILVGRNTDGNLEQLKQKLTDEGYDPGRFRVVKIDLSNPGQIRSGAERIRKILGDNKLNILLNHAGSAGPKEELEELPFGDYEGENIIEAMHNIFVGHWMLTKELVPLLTEGASVINTGTIFFLLNYFSGIGYVVPKGALDGFTDELSWELGRAKDPEGNNLNIRVNTVLPGPIGERIQNVFKAMAEKIGVDWEIIRDEFFRMMSINKGYVTAEELANAMVFLGSDESSTIAGQRFQITNGMLVDEESRTTLPEQPQRTTASTQLASTQETSVVFGESYRHPEFILTGNLHHQKIIVVGNRGSTPTRELIDDLNDPGNQTEVLHYELEGLDDEQRFQEWLRTEGAGAHLIVFARDTESLSDKRLMELGTEEIDQFVDHHLIRPMRFAKVAVRFLRDTELVGRVKPKILFLSPVVQSSYSRIITRATEILIRQIRHDQDVQTLKEGAQSRNLNAEIYQIVSSEQDSMKFRTAWVKYLLVDYQGKPREINLYQKHAAARLHEPRGTAKTKLRPGSSMLDYYQEIKAANFVNMDTSDSRGAFVDEDGQRQVLLVTGGSRGIGKATALTFLLAGANVGVMARNHQDMVLNRLELLEVPEFQARALDDLRKILRDQGIKDSVIAENVRTVVETLEFYQQQRKILAEIAQKYVLRTNEQYESKLAEFRQELGLSQPVAEKGEDEEEIKEKVVGEIMEDFRKELRPLGLDIDRERQIARLLKRNLVEIRVENSKKAKREKQKIVEEFRIKISLKIQDEDKDITIDEIVEHLNENVHGFAQVDLFRDRFLAVTGTIESSSDLQRFVETAGAKWGRIDHISNNAGATGSTAPIVRVPPGVNPALIDVKIDEGDPVLDRMTDEELARYPGDNGLNPLSLKQTFDGNITAALKFIKAVLRWKLSQQVKSILAEYVAGEILKTISNSGTFFSDKEYPLRAEYAQTKAGFEAWNFIFYDGEMSLLKHAGTRMTSTHTAGVAGTRLTAASVEEDPARMWKGLFGTRVKASWDKLGVPARERKIRERMEARFKMGGRFTSEVKIARSHYFTALDDALALQRIEPASGFRLDSVIADAPLDLSPPALEDLEKLKGKIIYISGEHFSTGLLEAIEVFLKHEAHVIIHTNTRQKLEEVVRRFQDVPVRNGSITIENHGELKKRPDEMRIGDHRIDEILFGGKRSPAGVGEDPTTAVESASIIRMVNDGDGFKQVTGAFKGTGRINIGISAPLYDMSKKSILHVKHFGTDLDQTMSDEEWDRFLYEQIFAQNIMARNIVGAIKETSGQGSFLMVGPETNTESREFERKNAFFVNYILRTFALTLAGETKRAQLPIRVNLLNLSTLAQGKEARGDVRVKQAEHVSHSILNSTVIESSFGSKADAWRSRMSTGRIIHASDSAMLGAETITTEPTRRGPLTFTEVPAVGVDTTDSTGNVGSGALSISGKVGTPPYSDDMSEWRRGGIDLNPANMDLKIKRDGNGVPLPVNRQNIEAIQRQIEGVYPVIINVVPAPSLPLLMGFNPANDNEPTDFGSDKEGSDKAAFNRDPLEKREQIARLPSRVKEKLAGRR